ncbi:hypothetical protein FFLO_05458 [Filobasidium floriforme]|uniref:PCI domain-containing protein n=1 Tax=Filobasidium floriforme TaxID=5210 RepID=A0A8K0NLG5_9TREE|nr:hypothetical protein FFLO_05458 [Filobasidium floriforme]
MQVDSTPDAYLDAQQARAPDQLKGWWNDLAKAYDRKLWHNVTVLLMRFAARDDSSPYLVELFENFVRPIESKLNPLRLVELARRVAREYPNPPESLSFLNSVHSRLPSPHLPPHADPKSESYDPSLSYTPPPPPASEAYALSLCNLAYALLLGGDLTGSKEKLDEAEGVLSGLDRVEGGGRVMGGFYGVSADYHKIKASYVPFYKSSLLFLACIDLETDLSTEERVTRAHDLGVAALLGDSIYNFGELLQHPILKALEGSQYEWIKDLLFVFNAGDLGKYDILQGRLAEEPILQADSDFLRQKICLMALIEAVFRRPRSQRAMSFQAIAGETKLPVEEVEHLVMKALSLGLIKGSIDQVNSLANIHWVQPRVLDADQSRALYERLSEWTDKIGGVVPTLSRGQGPLGVAA